MFDVWTPAFQHLCIPAGLAAETTADCSEKEDIGKAEPAERERQKLKWDGGAQGTARPTKMESENARMEKSEKEMAGVGVPTNCHYH